MMNPFVRLDCKWSVRWMMLMACFSLQPLSMAQFNPRQEGDAVWRWEASSDQGQSWTSGLLEVDSASTSVMVRARCQFTPFPGTYFGVVSYDAVIEGVGPNDSISQLRFGDTLFNVFLGVLNTQRFGSTLKIDWVDDTLPPGQGNRWLNPNQPSPQGGTGANFSNPFETTSYTLNLDGTVGDRVVQGVYRPNTTPGISRDRMVLVHNTINWYEFYYQTLREERVTIRVIPSPSVLAVMCIAFGSIGRRRTL